MIKGEDTYVIKNADAAFKKINEALMSAEKDAIILTSSKDVLRMWANKELLKSWQQKSVNVKIMAPITSDNFKAAREISKYFAIKHVAACHSGAIAVDGKHLFQFNPSLLFQDKYEGIRTFENTMYTSDPEFVQRTKNILSGIWKDSFDLSKVIVSSIARMAVPTVTLSTTVFRVASMMVKRKIGAVIVARDFEHLGIVTERDIIERVMLAKKDPQEILAQEIMTAPVVTIDCDRTIEKALEIMRKNKIRRLVVVKGVSMVGLLTERRLLLAQRALGGINRD